MGKPSPRNRRIRWLRWLFRLVVLLVLLAGLAIIQGIPGALVVRVLEQRQAVPGLLEMGDVVWRPGMGWAVEEVVWYSPRDLTRPLIQAMQVSWQPGRAGAPSVIRVGQGALSTELGMWTGRLGVSQPLRIEEVKGEVHWDKNQMSLEEIQFLFSGIQVDVDGTLLRTHPTEPEDPLKKEEGSLLERISRSLIPVVQGLESYSSTTTPILHVDVSGAQKDPTLSFHLLQTESFELRGNQFASLKLAGSLENRVLSLSEVEVLGMQDQKLSGTATVDFLNRMFDLTLDNSLEREALEALSPFSIDTLLSTIDLRVEGQASFAMRVGPASFDEPGERVRGAFTVEDASFRDAFFSAGTFEVDWQNPMLRLPSFSGTIGSGLQAGSVSGSLELQTETGQMVLNLEGEADPAQAVSLVNAEVESIIREWEFQGPPPEFKLQVDLPDMNSTADLQLMARAEKAVWRGTLFHNIRAVTSLDEKGLRIRDVTATRAAHLLEGNFSFPPDLSSCTFSIESNFPLPDMLPLLGQEAVDVVRTVRFLGPTRFSASGMADLSGANNHEISGDAVLERVSLNWVWFESLSSTFALKGQALDVPGIKGETVGGTLEADVRIRDLFEPDGRFESEVTIRDVDLFELITRATDTADTPYTGILGLDLVLSGALNDTLEIRRGSTFNGEGRIEIREGELFRIPLLLGLSSILNKVTKGFGYASQGDLDADFVIVDGQLSSKNVLVGGSVMSIAGTGGYNFENQAISGNVKVQLLKEGLMSDALKVLLWPIRKLIEVSLTGTLDNPDWRPRNLPKELFGK